MSRGRQVVQAMLGLGSTLAAIALLALAGWVTYVGVTGRSDTAPLDIALLAAGVAVGGVIAGTIGLVLLCGVRRARH